MVVQIEGFLLYNAAMNALLLLLCGRMSGLRIRVWRLSLAAGVGAGYAALSCVEPFVFLQAWYGKLGCAAGMTALAFLPGDGRKAARAALCLVLCTFLLGGTGFSLLYMLGARGYSWSVALLLAALGAAGCVALIHHARRARLHSVTRYVEIADGGREAGFVALLDTGNRLAEPLSGLPVMVVERRALAGLGDREGRPIAFRALSGEGDLSAFEPERIRVDGREAPRMMVAACDRPLCADRRYAALLPWACQSREDGEGDMKNWILRLWRRVLRLFSGEVHYVGGSEALPQPLSREEEAAIMDRLLQGDNSVRSTLIERNLRLVVYIARKFENTGVGLEDLISIGAIGLIKAVNTFDATKKIKLATYASRCIENEILMFLRRNSRVRMEVSLDEPLNTDWDGNELLLSDILGTDGDLIYRGIEEEADRTVLHQALTRLPPREKRIMQLRFGLMGGTEKTQKEVADVLGISQSYISRLEKRIMKRLRKDMSAML